MAFDRSESKGDGEVIRTGRMKRRAILSGWLEGFNPESIRELAEDVLKTALKTGKARDKTRALEVVARVAAQGIDLDRKEDELENKLDGGGDGAVIQIVTNPYQDVEKRRKEAK